MTTDTKATEYADGLRALADMIEDNPELAYILGFSLRNISEPVDNRDQLAVLARAGARSAGKVTKDYSGTYARVKVQFGPVTVEGVIERSQVCERVVVATESITELVPDPEALAALPRVERTTEREVVEWRCLPLLADEAAERVGVPA